MIKLLITLHLLLFLLGIAELPIVTAQQNATADTTYILDITWSPDGTRLAAVGVFPGILATENNLPVNTHGYLTVVDVSSGVTLFTIEPPSAFTSVAWSPDGQRLAIGSFDSSVWIVDAFTGERLSNLLGHQATITDVAWNSRGTQVVSSGNWDELVILWDAINYSVMSRFHSVGFPTSVTFSLDDQNIIVGTDTGVFLFPQNLQTEARISVDYELTSMWVMAMAYSPDGRFIAAGSIALRSDITGQRPNAQIEIIDVATNRIVSQFDSSLGSVSELSWNPDNRYLALLNEDELLTVWDIQAASVIATYPSFGVDRYNNGGAAYSNYGGRLAIGNWLLSNSSAIQPQIGLSVSAISIADGAVQIVVPDPSPERLQAIAEQCGAPLTVESQLETAIDAADMSSLIAQVESLPTGTIPPACAADLIAVAEAIQAQ